MKHKKVLKINHVKFAPIIGFGYWKDVYSLGAHGINGYALNIILPFVRIQIGELIGVFD